MNILVCWGFFTVGLRVWVIDLPYIGGLTKNMQYSGLVFLSALYIFTLYWMNGLDTFFPFLVNQPWNALSSLFIFASFYASNFATIILVAYDAERRYHSYFFYNSFPIIVCTQ